MLVMIAYSQNEDAKVKILLCEVNNFLDSSLWKWRKKREETKIIIIIIIFSALSS